MIPGDGWHALFTGDDGDHFSSEVVCWEMTSNGPVAWITWNAALVRADRVRAKLDGWTRVESQVY